MESVKRYKAMVNLPDGVLVADVYLSADFDRVSAENLALQQRLTVQDQREDELVELLTAAQNAMPWVSNSELWERIYAALKPTAEAEPNCATCKGRETVPSNLVEGYAMDCPDCCGEEG